MTSQPPAAPGAQKQGAASSEFTPEPLTEANKAALEQATKAPPPAPPPARTGGSGCLPADAEELRATFEQLTRGHKDAAALWESFQSKSDPTGLLQLAMKTRENVKLLEERISAFPLGLSKTAASPTAPAPAAAPKPAPAPKPAAAAAPPPPAAASDSPTRAQQPSAATVAEARQRATELSSVFDEAITCVGDVLAACSGHIDKVAANGAEAMGSVPEAASTVRLAYSELARARRAAQNAISGERAVCALLEQDFQRMSARAARLDELETQAADDRAQAAALREQLARATAALEEQSRRAEEYRLQLAAAALTAQRVKEKEASLDQQQVQLSELVERAASQMTADNLAARRTAEESERRAKGAQQQAEARLLETQTELSAAKIEIQQLKSDLVGAKLTVALKQNVL